MSSYDTFTGMLGTLGPEYDNSRVSCDEFTECCGINVLFSAYGPRADQRIKDEIERRKKLIREASATEGLLLYAATLSQKHVIKSLEKNKFEELTRFRNPKTGNTVILFGRVISPARKRKSRG